MPEKSDDQSQNPVDVNSILERAKAEWEAAFDTVSEGLIFVDTDGKAKRVNRAAARLLGKNIRFLPGQTCCELFKHHKDYDGACPVLNYPEGKKGTFEVFFPQYRFHEEMVHPIIRAGEQQGFVISVRDITIEQLAQEERKHLHLQLDEAGRRALRSSEETAGLREQLARADQTATAGRLAGVVFGEVERTVRMLDEGLSLLVDRCSAEKRQLDEVPEILTELQGAAGRCTRILRQLGALAVEDSDSRELLDLDQMVALTLKKLSRKAEKRKVPLEAQLDSPPSIEGNRRQIEVVLRAIVQNALEASESSKQKVIVRTGKEGKYSWFEVHDTGTGIAAEHLPRVFNPFFTTFSKGYHVGLGLTVCQAITRGHRGQLKVDTEPKEGTRVRCLFPSVTVCD